MFETDLTVLTVLDDDHLQSDVAWWWPSCHLWCSAVDDILRIGSYMWLSWWGLSSLQKYFCYRPDSFGPLCWWPSSKWCCLVMMTQLSSVMVNRGWHFKNRVIYMTELVGPLIPLHRVSSFLYVDKLFNRV